MEALELLEIIERGENSYHQFKRNVTNSVEVAQELAAFANSKGGMLIIGIEDRDGTRYGLDSGDIHRLNQLISNAATDNIRNPLNPVTENVEFEDGLVMVVSVQEGVDKPYITNDGAIYVKSGADKRKVTSREEIRRLFAEADLLHADEIPVTGATTNEIDENFFDQFYQQVNHHSWQEERLSLIQLLRNMNLAKGDNLNLSGLMIFGRHPQKFKPQFNVKAVYYKGNELTAQQYYDSEEINGRLNDQFSITMAFLKRNLRKVQQEGQSRNTVGELEIPEGALEELVANALIHRNYFIDAPVRLFMFDNRIELISPGILPNNLNEENVKSGVAVQRNPTIASFATKAKPPYGLPYRGMGTGILTAFDLYEDIEIINDQDNNQFVVKIYRP